MEVEEKMEKEKEPEEKEKKEKQVEERKDLECVGGKGLYNLNKKKHCDILLRTLLMGTGLVAGEWEADHQQNKKMLYIIEPVVESLLQVA